MVNIEKRCTYLEFIKNWLELNKTHEKLINHQTDSLITAYVYKQEEYINEIDLIEAYNLVKLAYSMGLKDGQEIKQ